MENLQTFLRGPYLNTALLAVIAAMLVVLSVEIRSVYRAVDNFSPTICGDRYSPCRVEGTVDLGDSTVHDLRRQ